MHTKLRQSGFSLIELAIALVIMGLIIGGTLAGRELISAARLRSVQADIEQYKSAVATFKTKYKCLPGDCIKATGYFGLSPYCSAYNTLPMTDSTCNGDGDGKVEAGTGGGNYYLDEGYLFWQQLSLAKLVQVTYSGRGNGLWPGYNVPASKVPEGCFNANYSDVSGIQQTLPAVAMGANVFVFGNSKSYNGTGAALNHCTGGLRDFPALAAYNIDAKMDDAMPFAGTVQTLLQLYGGHPNYSGNATPGCVNSSSFVITSAIKYDVAAASTACQLLFKAF